MLQIDTTKSIRLLNTLVAIIVKFQDEIGLQESYLFSRMTKQYVE